MSISENWQGTSVRHPAMSLAFRLQTRLSDSIAERSWNPGWINRYTTESIENLMSFNAMPYGHHVAPTPLLIIHGKNDKYCLPKSTQEVFDRAGEPKEIMWVDAPNHIDLYDVEKYVGPAVNKTVEWFDKYLAGKSMKHGLTV